MGTETHSELKSRCEQLEKYCLFMEQILRRLFYHRHAIGTKVEEEIAEEDHALWELCHKLLGEEYSGRVRCAGERERDENKTVK